MLPWRALLNIPKARWPVQQTTFWTCYLEVRNFCSPCAAFLIPVCTCSSPNRRTKWHSAAPSLSMSKPVFFILPTVFSWEHIVFIDEENISSVTFFPTKLVMHFFHEHLTAAFKISCCVIHLWINSSPEKLKLNQAAYCLHQSQYK